MHRSSPIISHHIHLASKCFSLPCKSPLLLGGLHITRCNTNAGILHFTIKTTLVSFVSPIFLQNIFQWSTSGLTTRVYLLQNISKMTMRYTLLKKWLGSYLSGQLVDWRLRCNSRDKHYLSLRPETDTVPCDGIRLVISGLLSSLQWSTLTHPFVVMRYYAGQ